MLQKQRASLVDEELLRDRPAVRLRRDAVARVQRKRAILDYLYAPLGNLRLVRPLSWPPFAHVGQHMCHALDGCFNCQRCLRSPS